MIRGALAVCAVVLLASGSRQAAAYFQCDSVDKSHAAFEALVPLRKALEQKDAAQLEKHYGKVLADYARDKTTDADVTYAFRIFRTAAAENEPFHEAWIKAFPKSEAAYLAQGMYYTTRAWAARGNAFASETAPSQFAAMEQAARKAAQALEEAAKRSKRPTVEAGRMLLVLQLIGSHETSEQFYRAALQRDPKAVELRVAYMDTVQPRWGGSLQALADVAREARSLPEADRRYVEYWSNTRIGSDYAMRKDDAHAAEFLERAIPLCPGLSTAAGDTFEVYMRTKNYPALIRSATQYINASPSDGSGWTHRGHAYTQVQPPDLQAAFKDYQRAAELDYPWGFDGLAWFYEGGRGGAPVDYRKAYELYLKAYEKGVTAAGEKAEKVRKGAHLQ